MQNQYSYRLGTDHLTAKIGVKDLTKPNKGIHYVAYLHFAMSMVLTALILSMAVGGVLSENQGFFDWSKTPLLLMNSLLFLIFWPMYAVGKIGLDFFGFLREQHPDKLDEQDPAWSSWVRRLTKSRPLVILFVVVLFVLAFAGFLSDNSSWWGYTKVPIMLLLLAYQAYHIGEVRKFREFIHKEMELLKRNLR
ncbi:hypothetical protein [Litoribacter populi]|uniref:hypothetical protein n=1 Tax=Litoribacter populi TaxID=2598460 RepID=UPI00117FA454|nr:hypothetical protein [Litoribacter populi]